MPVVRGILFMLGAVLFVGSIGMTFGAGAGAGLAAFGVVLIVLAIEPTGIL